MNGKMFSSRRLDVGIVYVIKWRRARKGKSRREKKKKKNKNKNRRKKRRYSLRLAEYNVNHSFWKRHSVH